MSLAKTTLNSAHAAPRFEALDLTRVDPVARVGLPAQNLASHFAQAKWPERRIGAETSVATALDATSSTAPIRARLSALELRPDDTPGEALKKSVVRNAYELNLEPLVMPLVGIGTVLQTIAFAPFAPMVRNMGGARTPHQEKLLAHAAILSDPKQLAHLAKDTAKNALASGLDMWANTFRPQAQLVQWIANSDWSVAGLKARLDAAHGELKQELAGQKRFVQALKADDIKAWDQLGLVLVGIGSLAANPNKASTAAKFEEKLLRNAFEEQLDPRARNFSETMRGRQMPDKQSWGVFYSYDLISPQEAAELAQYLKQSNAIPSGRFLYVNGIGTPDWGDLGITVDGTLTLRGTQRALVMRWVDGTLSRIHQALPEQEHRASSLMIAKNFRVVRAEEWGAHVDQMHRRAHREIGPVQAPTWFYPGAVLSKTDPNIEGFYRNSSLGVRPLIPPPGATTVWGGTQLEGMVPMVHSTDLNFAQRRYDEDRYSLFADFQPVKK